MFTNSCYNNQKSEEKCDTFKNVTIKAEHLFRAHLVAWGTETRDAEVSVTLRAAVSMRVEVTALSHTQILLWTQVYALATLAAAQR